MIIFAVIKHDVSYRMDSNAGTEDIAITSRATTHAWLSVLESTTNVWYSASLSYCLGHIRSLGLLVACDYICNPERWTSSRCTRHKLSTPRPWASLWLQAQRPVLYPPSSNYYINRSISTADCLYSSRYTAYSEHTEWRPTSLHCCCHYRYITTNDETNSKLTDLMT